MNIITENGQLELPEDFSIKIERHNPLLSGDGDASVPVTLPSSEHNLAVLGHRERVDRACRYTNKMDAVLEVGSITKGGQLLLDTVHKRDGVSAEFVIDNGDLYVKNKEKSLKEIFANYKKTLGTVHNVIVALEAVYNGYSNNEDYMVFPVAVSPRESNGTKTYQYNNEISNGHLVYEQREVWEDDIKMTVPKGYGISPFIRLHCMLDILFRILGYKVTYNCFAKTELKNLVLVNNCSDTIVTGTLHYADMVPSCTLSDFLEWMNNKFHAQPFVNSETKEVKIVMMEDILAGEADVDISNIVEDDFTVTLNPQKRVVLEPQITIDGTEAASDDFDALLEKYGGYYVRVDEIEFSYLASGTPINNTAFDCLILRMATGQFYTLSRDLNTANYKMVPTLVGSNIMKYDRKNTKDAESFKQDDVIPLMLCNAKFETLPFIGERIHFHTGYNAKEEGAEQEIIVVRGVVVSAGHAGFRTSGTIQSYLPLINVFGNGEALYGLTPYDLYSYFWKRYNELILNNATHLRGSVRLNTNAFLSLDMSNLKMFKNQKLLQVQASADIGNKIGATESEFIIAKSYEDGIVDVQPNLLAKSPLKWDVQDDAYNALSYYNDHIAYDRWVQVQQTFVHEWTVFIRGDFQYTDDLGVYWAGAPKNLGDELTINRQVRVSGTYWAYSTHAQPSIQSFSHDGEITVTFTAVANG